MNRSEAAEQILGQSQRPMENKTSGKATVTSVLRWRAGRVYRRAGRVYRPHEGEEATVPIGIFLLIFGLFFIIQCLPFGITKTPAIMDYPNHLARVFVLTHRDGDQ